MNFFVVILIVPPMLHHVPGVTSRLPCCSCLEWDWLPDCIFWEWTFWRRAGIGHGLGPGKCSLFSEQTFCRFLRWFRRYPSLPISIFRFT